MVDQRRREIEHPREVKDWAVLVFMKPDADLERAAIADIEEMKKVQRTDSLHVAVQVERTNDVERLEIRNGQEVLHPSRDPRPLSLAESLASFLEWGVTTFPAEHRMVVVWGHARGVGWDVKLPRRDTREAPQPIVPPAGPVGFKARPDLPSDGLTIPDIRALMAQFKDMPKLDLLGFDSCYMANAEFSCELADGVRYLVASQSPITNLGWDYQAVLNAIAGRRGVTPSELGQALVYQIAGLSGSTNISLVDLAKAPDFTAAFTYLVTALRRVAQDPVERRVLQILLARANFLRVRQFIDLRDLCYQVRDGFGPDVQEAAHTILGELTGFVPVHEAREGALGRLNGLSIYYPHVRASQVLDSGDEEPEANALVDFHEYEQLQFAEKTGWTALLRQLSVN